jgi:uncharacterized membrane protein YtjA (UPF0391 family)
MLKWALIFLIVALIAAVFGFGGLATGAAGIAKLLFINTRRFVAVSEAARLTDVVVLPTPPF